VRHAWSPDENELKEGYAVPGVRRHVRAPALFTIGQAWLYRIELKERYAVPGVRGHVRAPTLFAVGQVRPDGDDSQLVLIHGLQKCGGLVVS
jgi:hypothetical protein